MARQKSAPQGEPLPSMEQHWSVQQIAIWHQMKPDAVTAAIERGELKARRPSKAYQIPHSWYLEWLDACTVRPKSKREGATHE